LLKSKLRYNLAKFGFVHVVLVRGKEIWRLTGAEKISEYENIFSDKEKTRALARVFSLLRRFIRGEGSQAQLFADLENALVWLENNNTDRATFLISLATSNQKQTWLHCLIFKIGPLNQ
jgi:recombinational DNA repair protein (RecF pathway)